jgi:hypothetical protein
MRGYPYKPVLSSHWNWPLGWMSVDWMVLDWTGLDWTVLDWTVLDWTGVDWTGLGYWSLTLVMKRAPRIRHSLVGRRPR